MNSLCRTLYTMALATLFISNAHAAPLARTLDVTWYKDGQVIDNGEHSLSGAGTYLHRSGNEVGYATCTSTADETKLVANSVFIGRSLMIKPVLIDLDKVQLSVSATDTTMDGRHQTGTPDCVSEVVDAHGLVVKDIQVRFNGSQTVEVPLEDPHYRLVLRLHPDTL